MERQDLYLKPNAKKLALAIGFAVLFGLSTTLFESGAGAIKMVIAILGLLAMIGMSAIFVWIGWDGRRKLGYRWTDTLIASLVNGVCAMVALQIVVLVLMALKVIPAIESSAPPITLIGVLGFVLYFIWPAFFGLLGHAAAKYLGGKAAKPQPAKAAGSKRKH